MPIIECIPNFSEGQDPEVIQAIAQAIELVPNVQLLHRDPGYAANRTVFTFAGPPAAVVEAAFQAIKIARNLIDMNLQSGEHPRMGAADVCPMVPIKDISMEEVVAWSRKLGQRVGEELQIPVFLYENSATAPHRRNLANIRKGEYEGLPTKMQAAKWQADFGPKSPHPTFGAMAIGARPFLIAYNVNLASDSVAIAKKIACEVRESGCITGHDSYGQAIRTKGLRPGLKAIGWYIDEFECAQVSMNLTDISQTNMHEAFEACRSVAQKYGVGLNGSELVGLAPLSCFVEAGRFYTAEDLSEKDMVQLAIEKLGLNALAPFDPNEKILDYQLGF